VRRGGMHCYFCFSLFLRIPLDLAFFLFPVQVTSDAGLSEYYLNNSTPRMIKRFIVLV
jgi:hypothetical protein